MTQIHRTADGQQKLVASQQELLSDTEENDILFDLMVEDHRLATLQKFEMGMQVHRHGILGAKLAETRVYLYDNPGLRKICRTGFTEGFHIFLDVDFYRTMKEEEEASNGAEKGALPLLKHEAFHILLNHANRLQQFPRDVANEAEDRLINSRMLLSFPNEHWVPSFREIVLATQVGEKEKFANLSEETIARLILEERKQEEQKGKGKGKAKGSSGSGEGSPGGQGEQGDEEENEEQDNKQFHTISPEEFIDILEEEGLSDIRKKLNLPEPGDKDAIGDMQDRAQRRDVEIVEQAEGLRQKLKDLYPGSHCLDAVAEVVKGYTKGKLSYKMGMRDFVAGSGMNFQKDDNEPGMVWYIPAEVMGLTDPIYDGAVIPHKSESVYLALVDTSGSVDSDMLREFLNEIIGMQKENAGSQTASEIVVVAADTVIRQEPLVLNEYNIEDYIQTGVKMSGRGGTDLAEDLRQTMALEIFKEKKIRGVLFFTDLGDRPPTLEDFQQIEQAKDIPLAFVTCENTYSEHFENQVSQYARVYVIPKNNYGANTEVDLTDEATAGALNRKKRV